MKKLHLWLGLLSGLVVFIIALTGCIYAFQQEILDATEGYRFVQKEEKAYLRPSELVIIAQQQLPGKELHSIKYYKEKRAVEAVFYHYEPTYYEAVYINPYSGKVLAVEDLNKGFFRFILNGHFYLWLPPEVGQPVVAIFTLIFFAMIITGLIIWFPKNKHAFKQRIWFRWKNTTKWRRKNFDLHGIIGFYASLIAIIFVLTGLVWGFRWFAYAYHKAWGGTKSLVYEEPLSVKANPASQNILDFLYQDIRNNTPEAASIELHPPTSDTATISVNTNVAVGTYWQTDYRYYDQYTGKEKPVHHLYGRFADAGVADKVMRMNYDIHTGGIWGIAGKIFAFLMSLLIASLPVTGVLVYIGRKKKQQPKKR
ncbi:PepSY domain-containing protein [Taibaiella sp. KBW10]|uniref:PepSY-associated TM helix domain-containing protein n=1 Tax=Taibaiella sp. KBW10 TaxID=2153357 RepID=UPI001F26B9CA|nr:PepSY-associated TM helix domain-containing protein [Taibaiella sp. KBW10]